MDAPKLMFKTSEEIKTFRKKLGMVQADFWGRIGLTQSGGSRYECDRNTPETVLTLLPLAYAPDDRAQRLVEHLRSWKKPRVGSGDATPPELNALP